MIRQNFINRGQRLSPSARKIIKLRQRAIQLGGAALELQTPTNYIREVSRDLNYDITSDASLIMVPNTIGESRLFNCKPDGLRNLLLNSATGTTQSKTVTARPYTLQLKGTGTYILSGAFSGSLVGTGVSDLVTLTFTPTAGSLTLTVSGSITEVQLEVGSIATTYQRTTDGIIDFQATRATTATGTQKDGSIGQSCYNIFTFSEDFTNAAWSKSSTTISANQATNPNGNLTASKLFEFSATTTFRLIQNITNGVSGNVYTFSAYIKKFSGAANERRYFGMEFYTGSDNASRASVVIDSQTGLVTQTRNANVASPAIALVFNSVEINGYFRCSITTTANFNGNFGSSIFISDTANPVTYVATAPQYTGNTSNFITVWGAQLVQGSTPKDYLRTTNRLNVPSIDYSLGSSLPAFLVEPQRTNIIFPSATATTQSRTVTAQPYTLSFYGTGTVTLSGVFSGSLVGTGANNLVFLTFTPTAGSLTFTITGSVTNWQCEAGTFLTSRIITTTATATRNAYASFLDMFNNSILNKDNLTLFIEGYIDFRHSLNPWLGFSDSATLFTGNSLYLYNGNAVGYYVGGARTDIALTTSDDVYFKTVIKKSGTSLKVFSDGVLKATDTLAVFDYRYLIISDGSARNFVQKLSLWKRTLSDADCILLTS